MSNQSRPRGRQSGGMSVKLATALAISVAIQLISGAATQLMGADELSELITANGGEPRRQYLIAPRVGRSLAVGGGAGRQPNVPIRWALEEGASFQSPGGQVQPHLYGLGRPPMQASSLLFLIGGLNRRLRSPTGLVPQARIGRRSAPAGLLVQPRLGRRSGHLSADEQDHHQAQLQEDDGADQMEVALAALNDDQAMGEAIQSLLNQ